MARSAEQAAHNESVFRRANEHIEERLEELSVVDGNSPFVCECESPDCAEIVRLSRAEYEDVRAAPDQFVITPGHEFTDGSVVRRTDRYEVIRKHGIAAEIAHDTYPRRAG